MDSDDPPVQWVVQAWRERGLLSEADQNVRTREDLAKMHGDSWFIRRNKQVPPRLGPSRSASINAGENSGWLARRNRKSTRASCDCSSRPPLRRQSSLLEQAIHAKLTLGVKPLLAEPAKISPCPSYDGSDDTHAQAIAQPPAARSAGAEEAALAELDSSDPPNVYLTLYDLYASCNALCAHWWGIGLYHSGILLQGVEYTFDNIASTVGSGVIAHTPYFASEERRASMPLRCKVLLGRSRLSATAAHDTLLRLAPLWPAHSYDLLEHNCHHWSSEAARVLGVQPPPKWVMRAHECLRFFSGVDSGERPHAPPGAGRAPLSPKPLSTFRSCSAPGQSDGRREAFGDDDEACQSLLHREVST